MGLIEQEILELRKLAADVLSGEVKVEVAATQISIFNQVAKREMMICNLLALGAKYGNKITTPAIATNIMGNGTAIDLGVSGIEEKIKCPEHGDSLINRGQCLDYSGLERNIDKCQKCKQFVVTRKYMAP